MKIETVIIKQPERRIQRRPTYIVVFLAMFNMISTVLLPFTIGFYLARTNQLYWLIPLGVLLFFEGKIEYVNGTFKFKIFRWL